MPEENAIYASTGERIDTTGHEMDEMSRKARQQASQFAGQMERKVHSGKERVADSLDRAASSLEERADRLPGGERVRHTAHQAAEKLGNTAGYLRSHDAQSMGEDARSMVRSHPGRSLLMALGAGFLIGRVFRGR